MQLVRPHRGPFALSISANCITYFRVCPNAGGDTSPPRSSSATTSGLPDAAPGTAPGAVTEISRFPCRRRPYMPQTTRGGPRTNGPDPVAFCCHDGIGTPDYIAFAAPYLACTHPCQRFTPDLTGRGA